jgi:type III secretory pathway component EscT
VASAHSYLENLGVHVDIFRFMTIGGLIFMRLFVVITMVPFIGGRMVPGRVKLGFCLALILLFYGPVSGMSPEKIPESTGILIALFLKEIFFGILLSLSVTMVFYGIQAAGNMVDNQRQLANARIFNPALGTQASLFGSFYFQFSLVLFLVLGGHRMFLKGIGESFISVPVLALPHISPGVTPVLDLILRIGGDSLLIALQLSAPVLVAIFVADLILGLTNRVAPMINVFEMGFNIKGYVGVLLAYLGLPLVYHQMKVWFLKTLSMTESIIHLFLR